jgi:hypothetical protein
MSSAVPRHTTRPTRFLRLADGRMARFAPRDATPWPHGDHVPVTIAPLGAGPAPEMNVTLPERWAELRDGALRTPVAAALTREVQKR